MTGSIAEGASLLGLIVGFPLLLLGLMISLEKLESWGLREAESKAHQPELDKVDAAVQSVENMKLSAASPEVEPTAATSANGQAQQPVHMHD